MKVFLDAMAHIPHVSVGDHALIWGAVEIVRRRFPDAKFTFFCKYPEHERMYLNKMDFDFSIVNRSHNQFVAGWQARKLAQDSDLVVSAWGDGFIMNPPHRVYRKVKCLDTGRTPLALCSTSMGPFAPSGLKRWMAKSALEKYDCLTVRDTITYKYIRELGIDKVEQIPDTAFALHPCSPDRVDQVLLAEKIPLRMPYVGFNLGVEFMKFCKEIGVDYIGICRKVIDRIRQKYKCAVVLIPHQYFYEEFDYAGIPGMTYEGCDDRYAIDRVWDSMSSLDDLYRLSGGVYSCAELKGVIGRADAFISQRVHPLVASTSMSVPTAIMHYSHKAKGMMEMMGKEKYVWHPTTFLGDGKEDTSIGRLLEIVDELWESRLDYNKDLSRIMPSFVDRAYSLGDKIATIV